MKGTELLRLVWLNINQNKFKTVMTSIGIVVGAATIVMVIAIGRGGQMDVAEQFSSLNAGAIDISYEWEGEENTGEGSFSPGGFGDLIMGGIGNMFGSRNGGDRGGADTGQGAAGFSDRGNAPGGISDSVADGQHSGGFSERMDAAEEGFGNSGKEAGEGFGGFDGRNAGEENSGGDASENRNGGFPGGGNPDDISEQGNAAEENQENSPTETAEEEDTESITADRMNQENVILSMDDVEDIETFIPDLSGVTLSYSTKSSVEGGNLTEAQTYTVAGVKSSYGTVSNLVMAEGSFLTDEEDDSKARVCVLGASAAKQIFGSAEDAYESTVYIDDRAYEIIGVLESSGTVSAGITPDESVFVPYQTGIKYITGENISPVITVISEDINGIGEVKEKLEMVLEENYSNAEFTFSDAGSKMEAAESSNEILTMLLSAMAVIVFLVGGIGIMNVLFVSVKERTNEIGILKSLGASGKMILFEFLLESAAISLIGGVLGVGLSFAVTPIVEYYDIRVEANVSAWLAALGFAILTGTLFGIYPAWKASRLVPVDALNAE